MYDVSFSKSFTKRAAQLQISPRDVAFVLKHGRVLYRTGIKFYFLGRKDIPEAWQRYPRIARLEGITLLLSHTGNLINVYKNPEAARKIRQKSKHRWPAYPAHRPARVSRPLPSPAWESESPDREVSL